MSAGVAMAGGGGPRRLRSVSLRERSVLVGGSRNRFWSGLFASLAAHVAVFGGAWLYAHLAPARTVPEKPIVAKLVRLGKPRDEKLLPRLPAKPPPAPPPPVAAVPAPVPTPPVPDAAPAKTIDAPAKEPPKTNASQEALERQRRMMDALSKLGAPTDGPTAAVAEALPGQADGDPQGDAEEAAEGDRYLALVEQAIRRNYQVPTIITQQERLFLKAKIFLKIAVNGNIEDFRVVDSSGNAQFDRAVEASLQRTTLPPPPPAFFKTYGDEGIEIGFKP